ncbi:unnamed protein product [Symbiodinium microadriaticum]|nr:unnamed protein product [Symbiodinium microadriaticum]
MKHEDPEAFQRFWDISDQDDNQTLAMCKRLISPDCDITYLDDRGDSVALERACKVVENGGVVLTYVDADPLQSASTKSSQPGIHVGSLLAKFGVGEESNHVTYLQSCDPEGDSYAIWTWGGPVYLTKENLIGSTTSPGQAFSAAISACSRGGQGQLAPEVFRAMREEQLVGDVITYNAAISAREQQSQWLEALDMLAGLSDWQLQATVVTYGAVLSACEKAGEWQAALQVLTSLLSHHPGNIITLNAAISACEKAGEWQWALHLLVELRALSLEGTVVSFSSAISSFEKLDYAYSLGISACEKGLQWRWALHTFAQIHKVKLHADSVSYNALVSAFEKGAEWQRSLASLAEMLLLSVPTNVVTFSATISTCQKATQWERSLCLLLQCRRRHRCNVITYNAALAACEDAAEWQQALLILGFLRSDAVDCDATTMETTMRACGRAEQWERALGLLAELPAQDVPTTLFAVNAALGACENAAEWRQALHLFQQLQVATLQGDTFTYSAIISACGRSSQWQRALPLLGSLQQAHLQADVVTFSSAVGACALGEHWQAAVQVLADAHELHLRGDVITYAFLIAACAAGNAPWYTSQFLNDIKELAFLPLQLKCKVQCREKAKASLVHVEARHGHDVHAASAVRPVCTEPYCGGFWWAQPKPAVPKIDGELGKAAKREKESNPVPVDFPDVSYYPAFDPPIASKVHLLRANKGYYDRWNVPHAVTVTVETPSDLKFLANEVLNNFMRVQEDAGLGHPERVVRQGLQLISWKSMQGGGRLHVTPFLGSKKELLSSSLPVKLTFGGKPTVPKEGGRLFGEFRERCEPGDLIHPRTCPSGPSLCR